MSALRTLALFATLSLGRLAPTGAASLPVAQPPDDDIVRVASAAELQVAIATVRSGQTILLTPGIYPVPGAAYFLPEHRTGITIAGATGNRDDVTIRGGRFSIWANAVDRLTVRDLTLEDAAEHGIILNCEAQAPVVRNVVLRNIGDQFIKVNPGPGGCGVDDGLVEDSLFEYTNGAPDTYTNGVDVHFGARWTIRRNLFRGFFTAGGGVTGPAVLLWNGSRDSVVEANTFVDNVRDIALGLDPGRTNESPVRNGALTDHAGGRISGNSIRRRATLPGADVAISVADSPQTRVEGNIVTMAGSYPAAIEYRFPRTVGVVVAGNMVDGQVQARDGATATVFGNIVR